MPREKRTFTRISGVRNPSLIVIASEGRKTEPSWPQQLGTRVYLILEKIQMGFA